jgi:hypothetical protein
LILLEFFEPKTIFIGEWSTKFNTFRFFLNFLTSNDQIDIQPIKFKFKQTNQKLITHYHPPTSVKNDSTNVPPDPAATSFHMGGSD